VATHHGWRLTLDAEWTPRRPIGLPQQKSAQAFGLKVGMVGKVKFEARIKELVENQPDLVEASPSAALSRRKSPWRPPILFAAWWVEYHAAEMR
jgi:hypothetical protein